MGRIFDLFVENLSFVMSEFFLGAIGAWLISYLGFRMGFVDMPTGRSSHSIPTPKGGGVGILFAFLLACLLYHIPAGFYLPVAIVSIVSFLGDRINISPFIRLIVQFVAAFVLFLNIASVSLSSLSLYQCGLSSVIFVVLSLFATVFITGTANFYNFMDGINGIAAITGIIGFGMFTCYGVSYHKAPGLVMVCLGLATACAGFLPFNFPRAKVFMGDVGSVLLGFVFGAVVIVYSSDLKEFFLLASFLFPFYADELVTMAERIMDRQSLTQPHRRHLYQVLANEAGIAHWKISCGYGLFQLFAILLFWKISGYGFHLLAMAVVTVLVLFLLVNNMIKAKFLKKGETACKGTL